MALHNIELDYAKRDSHSAACGGVVLQRFEFIKVCMGTKPVSLKHGLRTTDFGLRTGYKTRTEV